MTFAAVLNEYCEQLGCTNKELAQQCGMSPSSLSRYRNGERVPDAGSATLRKIAVGIAALARSRDAASDAASTMDVVAVQARLASALAPADEPSLAFSEKLNMLMDVLRISNVDMARFANVDPSYLSRIRSGQRMPSDFDSFAHRCAEFAARRCVVTESVAALSLLLGEDGENVDDCTEAIDMWLRCGESSSEDASRDESNVASFFAMLDEFNLDEYIRAIHFDTLKVPTVPFSLPTSKQYFGVEAMREGELDFLRFTACSKEAREVVMCSDMSMEELAKDMDFNKKWMFGLAALLKRGVRISVVHNLNRPFAEMMLGLESWIPLYMTGQVAPYYLMGEHNKVFCHLTYASDVAALSGEGIAGHPCEAHYYLTKKKSEVSYYRLRMQRIVEKARPLMEIYREDDPARFDLFKRSEAVRALQGDGRVVGEDVFTNIHIVVYEGDCVVVSKRTDPAIHFVIRHPKLREAIEHMVPAVVE